MFPIKYPAIWEMYKKAEASFWTGAAARLPHAGPRGLQGAVARPPRWPGLLRVLP